MGYIPGQRTSSLDWSGEAGRQAGWSGETVWGGEAPAIPLDPGQAVHTVHAGPGEVLTSRTGQSAGPSGQSPFPQYRDSHYVPRAHRGQSIPLLCQIPISPDIFPDVPTGPVWGPQPPALLVGDPAVLPHLPRWHLLPRTPRQPSQEGAILEPSCHSCSAKKGPRSFLPRCRIWGKCDLGSLCGRLPRRASPCPSPSPGL